MRPNKKQKEKKKWSEQMLCQRRYRDGKQTHPNIFNTISHVLE